MCRTNLRMCDIISVEGVLICVEKVIYYLINLKFISVRFVLMRHVKKIYKNIDPERIIRAIKFDNRKPILDGSKCVGCQLCKLVCPQCAIEKSSKRAEKKLKSQDDFNIIFK